MIFKRTKLIYWILSSINKFIVLFAKKFEFLIFSKKNILKLRAIKQ